MARTNVISFKGPDRTESISEKSLLIDYSPLDQILRYKFSPSVVHGIVILFINDSHAGKVLAVYEANWHII